MTDVIRQPLVSIITGYYNRLDNLVESVQSILNQSYDNFEYIIFDDCSSDGTQELLESIQNPKLRLIKYDENMGFTKGMIRAISYASGKYIALHGAGDISFSNRIRKQVELLQSKEDIGVVGCLIEDVSAEGINVVSPAPKSLMGSHLFSHGEVMFRKSLYYLAGGYNALFKYGQFSMLKLEMLKLSRPAFVNEILYRRIHYSNGVTKNKQKRLEQILNIHLGINFSKSGLWNVDISMLVIAFSFQNVSLIKKGSSDESRLKFHLSSKTFYYSLVYFLYKIGALPGWIVSKFGSYLRRINNL